MKNYKEFQKISIGCSDIATLIAVGCPVEEDDPNLKLQPVYFGQDDSYRAYIVEGEAVIGKHYRLIATFRTWLKIYDDEGLVYNDHRYDHIFKLYRAREMGFIIQIKEIKNKLIEKKNK